MKRAAFAALLVAAACDQTLQFTGEPTIADGGGAGSPAASCGCKPDQQCAPDGGCMCAAGLSRCGDACVDLSRDVGHCGACGVDCKTDEACMKGACACAPGHKLCDKRCVDITKDPEHCGSCDTECTKSPACSAGECTPSCGPGLVPCPLKGGQHIRCVPAAGDDENCGGCGVHCPSGKRCVAGACAAAKPATPCVACPCAACEAVLGRPGVCCPSSDGPLCVAASGCP